MLRSVVVLLIGTFVLAGCRVGAPPAAPPEQFGDFSVGLFGGVAGEQRVLRVRADGVAVLASRDPASGRIGAAALERLRTLLTSEQFRREVAATATQPPGSQRCSDLFIREVTMGALTVRKSDRCGNEERPDTPAFDEIIALLHDGLDGRFEAPVADGGDSVSLRLERTSSGSGPVVIEADRSGRLTRRGVDAGLERRTLTPSERDTLALLVDVLREAAPVRCETPGRYALTIRTEPVRSGSECAFRSRSPQFFAIAALLDAPF